uniref:Uncharacterized protein n=1 Tax=Lepeophtheirus salmonis TaxID=72036 RepID=A0A0K2TN26_LEPSM
MMQEKFNVCYIDLMFRAPSPKPLVRVD